MAGWREMILLRHRRMVGRLFAPAHEAASPASGASRFRAYRVTTMLLSRWISLLLAHGVISRRAEFGRYRGIADDTQTCRWFNPVANDVVDDARSRHRMCQKGDR